jgi:hypothetical protein
VYRYRFTFLKTQDILPVAVWGLFVILETENRGFLFLIKKNDRKSCLLTTFIISLQNGKQCSGSAAGTSGCERKVRAVQGAPLPKTEAIGDSRC